jgi:hypothetical protein
VAEVLPISKKELEDFIRDFQKDTPQIKARTPRDMSQFPQNLLHK